MVYYIRFTPQGAAQFRFASHSNGMREAFGEWAAPASWRQSRYQVFSGAWRDAYIYDFNSAGWADTYMSGFGIEVAT